jgi:opacity protein-like surface antigen
VAAAVLVTLAAAPASAQDMPVGVRGFGSFGNIVFTAQDSFDAVLGQPSGPIYGGGGQVLLPFGIYAEVSFRQFKRTGERVFVGPDDEVFPLGIPLQVTIQPLDITAGWRAARWGRFVPYGGGGFSSYRYKETSDFADPGDDVDERFTGFHVVGGAEYLVLRWIAVGGEVSWSTIPDALGQGGASAAFGEDDLGGTTFRLKISVGR